MTKIKNTKKGMAKKTLSMSLVVAMLATSNVPVWAAEFSDGSDVAVTSDAEVPVVTETPADDTADAFSAEEEAPVVTDETADAATEVVEKGDLILDNVTVSKSQTFGLNKKVAVTGTIKYRDGKDAKVLDDYWFGWRVKGTNNAIFTDHIAKDNTTDKMSFYPDFAGAATYNQNGKKDWIESAAKDVDWSQYAGKTLELYVYNNEADDNIKIDPTVIGETTIEKCPIEGTLKLSKDGVTAGQTLEYNGKDFYYTNDSNDGSDNAIKLYTGGTDPVIVVTSGDATPGKKNIAVWDSATVSKYFDVAATKTARNAGEKLTVTATAKKDSPYIGTISAKELEVQKKLFDANDFDLSVAEGLSYQYTGAAISVPTDKISFKEKADKLAGVDLSSAVKEAETVVKGPAGQVNVKVTFDTSKLPNFKFTADETEDTRWKTAFLITGGVALNQNVEITKRDLSTDATTVTLKHGRVMTDSTVAQFLDNLKFSDKAGNALPLTLGTDYNLYIENPDKSATTTVDVATSPFEFEQTGTYVVTISAKEGAGQTCVKSQKINVEVAKNVISKIETSNNYAPYYTGTEIKPSKSDLGKLKIYDVNTAAVSEELQDNHYDIISAFIKSMRGSDPDAAVFYLAKMLYAGEDVKFIARRIMICASEDVGNADPMALTVAVAAAQAVERIGMPESQIILSQAVTYVASAPKSNAAVNAIFAATEAVKKYKTTVPSHLQDAHYKGAEKLGHGTGYKYAHDYPGHYVEQQYLPDEIKDARFYEPGDLGYEKKIKEHLQKLRKQ